MARSEVNYIYDAANAFRAPALAAVTASGVIGSKPLDKLANVRPSSQRDKLGAEEYKIVIVVESLVTGGVSPETYTFAVGAGIAESTTVQVGELAVTAPGQYVIILDAHSIEKLSATREDLELSLTVAGTAPSIRFSSWLL